MCEFNRESFLEDQRSLIPGVLRAGQPGVISGPAGSLKTAITLDLLIAVATGRDFLGHFPVTEPGPTLLITHETMRSTIQDLTRRICAQRGVDPDGVKDFCVCTEWPDLRNIAHLARLRELITRHKLKVVAIDLACVSLSFLKNRAPGEKPAPPERPARGRFRPRAKSAGGAVRLARSTGCSVLFVHVDRCGRDVAQTPFAEFAAQWIQLSRRTRSRSQRGLDPQTGNHELWMNCGSLDCEAGTWAVDVQEGEPNQPGRHWHVEVLSPDAARARVAEQDQRAFDQRREARVTAPLQRDRKRILDLLDDARDGLTATALRNLLCCNSDWARRVLQSLLLSGEVETNGNATGRGGAPLYRLPRHGTGSPAGHRRGRRKRKG